MEAAPVLRGDTEVHPLHSGWVNLLPRWILEDPRFQRLRPQMREGLQSMASAGRRHPSGEITDIVGGQTLHQRMGVSKATFFRWLRVYESHGYIVPLRLGGGRAYINGENLANAYGIPHKSGSLDIQRRYRRTQHMVLKQTNTGRSRFVPVRTLPGDQQEFTFHDPPPNHTLVSKRDYPSLTMRLPPSQNETGIHNHSYNSSHNKTKIGFCAQKHREPSPGRPRHWRITEGQLRDTGLLLGLYERMLAAEPRLPGVQGGEAGRLRFLGYAEHAIRVGTRNRPGLFYAMLRDDPEQRERRITLADEEAARKRLNAHLFPDDGRREDPRENERARMREREGEWPAESEEFHEPGPPATPSAEVSADARTVARARAVAARASYRGDPFHLLKANAPDWTRGRWDAAVRELDRSGGMP